VYTKTKAKSDKVQTVRSVLVWVAPPDKGYPSVSGSCLLRLVVTASVHSCHTCFHQFDRITKPLQGTKGPPHSRRVQSNCRYGAKIFASHWPCGVQPRRWQRSSQAMRDLTRKQWGRISLQVESLVLTTYKARATGDPTRSPWSNSIPLSQNSLSQILLTSLLLSRS
jgi:hypothetical protein